MSVDPFFIEQTGAEYRCASCGAEVDVNGESLAQDSRNLDLAILRLAELADRNPTACSVALLYVHPTKYTLREIGAKLGISHPAVRKALTAIDRLWPGWRKAGNGYRKRRT